MPDHRLPLLIGLRVQHRQKMRSQLARLVLHRKILLVIAHHRHQHLFRQRQILRLKVTQHHRRPLRQVRHRLDQRLILAPPRARPPSASPDPAPCESSAAAPPHRPPHTPLSSASSYFARRLQRNRRIAKQHAMPIRHRSRRHARQTPPAPPRSPSIATIHRTGRTNRSGFPARQYMFFAQ